MRLEFIFFAFVIICANSAINDTFPQLYQISDERNFNNLLINLNGYQNVIITNNTFTNVTFHIQNAVNLTMEWNTFVGYNQNSTLKLLDANTTVIRYNTWGGANYQTQVQLQSTCVVLYTYYTYLNASSNTTFTSYYGNLTAIGTHNISLQSNTNVTSCTPSLCYYQRSEVEVYFSSGKIADSLIFAHNWQSITNGVIPSKLLSFMKREVNESAVVGFPFTIASFGGSRNKINIIDIYNNSISVVRTNPYSHETILIPSNSSVFCTLRNEYDLAQTYAIDAYKSIPPQQFIEHTSLYLDLNNFEVLGYVRVMLNQMTFLATGAITKTIHSSTDWMFDSMILIRLGNVIIPAESLIVRDNSNSVRGLGAFTTGLEPPVRVGILLANTTLSALLSALPPPPSSLVYPSGTPSYQFAPHLINELNPRVRAFHFRTQIERNRYLDPYSGWDECHYSCKENCTDCIYTDKAQLGEEFSIYTHGACFNREVFSNSTRALRLCRHRNLLITPPVLITQASIISTKNKVDGYLNILKRYNYGYVRFTVEDSVGAPEEHYKYSYDKAKYIVNPDDTYFIQHHPYLIIPSETWELDETTRNISQIPENENAVLKSLTISGVELGVEISGSNRHIFSVWSYQPLTIPWLDLFSITNSTLYAYSAGGSPGFQLGFHILQNSSTEVTYSATVGGIRELVFEGNVERRLDVFSDGPLIVPTVSIRDNAMYTMENGWLILYSENQTIIKNNICYDCRVSSVHKSWLYVNGSNRDVGNNSEISYNTFQNSVSAPDITLANRIIVVRGYNYIDIHDNSAIANWAVGLYFQDLGNLPCGYRSFVTLDVFNPQVNGSVYDFYCDPLAIGCKDDTCYDDISLAPPFCVVNQSLPITTPGFRIQYFNSLPQAIRLCWDYYDRDIYLVSDVYYEDALTFKPKNIWNETLRIFPYIQGQESVIVGASHVVSAFGTGNSNFRIHLDSIRFFNPLGVFGAYASGVTPFILNVIDETTLNLTISNSRFYGFKPITPVVSMPTNIQDWITFLDNFVSQPLNVHPRIREPNTNILINVKASDSTSYINLKLYGSVQHGLVETKSTATETFIWNVYAENMWSNFISVQTQYDVEIQYLNCTEFCGGQTSEATQLVIVNFRTTPFTGRRFIFKNNALPPGPLASAGHPYVSQRMPYGNYFLGFLSSYAGYLSAVMVQNMDGPSWVDFKWRNNYIPRVNGYPIAVNLESSSNLTIHSMNFRTIMRDDGLVILRQIQVDNCPLGDVDCALICPAANPVDCLGGTWADIKAGTMMETGYKSAYNWCSLLCLPPLNSQICTVDTTLVTTTENFHLTGAAIPACRYSTIVLVNPPPFENINTNFAYRFVREQGPTLTIRSYNNAITSGYWIINQTCSAGLDYIPTEIIFQGFTIRDPDSVDNSTTSHVHIRGPASAPGCYFPSIKFVNSPIRLMNTSFTGVLNGITCSSCDVGLLRVETSSILGPLVNGIDVDATSSVLKPRVELASNSIGTVSGMAVSIKSAAKVTLTSNTELCENSSPSYGCQYILGSSSLGLIPIQISSNIIHSNDVLGPSYPYSGFVWNLNGVFTLAQIEEVLNATRLNRITASRYGIHIIATGVDNEYPCTVASMQTLRSILGNNSNIVSASWKVVISDPGGIIIGLITTGVGGTQCFRLSSVDAAQDAIYVIVVISLIAGFLFGIFAIWWFQLIRCAWGIHYIEHGDTKAIKKAEQKYDALNQDDLDSKLK